MADRPDPSFVLNITPDMIADVWEEWDREHPGVDLPKDEFERRLMAKMRATYRPVMPGGKA